MNKGFKDVNIFDKKEHKKNGVKENERNQTVCGQPETRLRRGCQEVVTSPVNLV